MSVNQSTFICAADKSHPKQFKHPEENQLNPLERQSATVEREKLPCGMKTKSLQRAGGHLLRLGGGMGGREGYKEV